MSPKTKAVLDAIKEAIADGQDKIAPAIYSACFGPAATSAAFRIAKRDGLIEVNYTSVAGTPVYRAAGIGAALAEREAATIN